MACKGFRGRLDMQMEMALGNSQRVLAMYAEREVSLDPFRTATWQHLCCSHNHPSRIRHHATLYITHHAMQDA